jgi:hypothetical protein
MSGLKNGRWILAPKIESTPCLIEWCVPVAQWITRQPSKLKIVGSIPTWDIF